MSTTEDRVACLGHGARMRPLLCREMLHTLCSGGTVMGRKPSMAKCCHREPVGVY